MIDIDINEVPLEHLDPEITSVTGDKVRVKLLWINFYLKKETLAMIINRFCYNAIKCGIELRYAVEKEDGWRNK